MIQHYYDIPQDHPTLVFRDKDFEIVIPEHPLASDALVVSPVDLKKVTFEDWNCDDIKEANSLLQRVAKAWDQKGTDNFLIYGDALTKPFSWQIVPYQSDRSSTLQKIEVICHVIWPASSLSEKEVEEQKTSCQSALLESENHEIKELSSPLIKDAFCNSDVIAKQIIYEGKLVRVLYNYAPIAEAQFLIVSKAHRNSFTELTLDEYVEEQLIAQRLISYLKSKGFNHIALEEKKGVLAGQTQPHQHLNVLATKSSMSSYKSMLLILKNVLFGKSPLSEDELQQKVLEWREVFTQLMRDPLSC